MSTVSQVPVPLVDIAPVAPRKLPASTRLGSSLLAPSLLPCFFLLWGPRSFPEEERPFLNPLPLLCAFGAPSILGIVWALENKERHLLNTPAWAHPSGYLRSRPPHLHRRAAAPDPSIPTCHLP